MQSAGIIASVSMPTSSGPWGPLLCRVLRRVTSTSSLTVILSGGSINSWPTILMSASPTSATVNSVEAALLVVSGSTTWMSLGPLTSFRRVKVW